jgi:hypothetical protein
MNVYRRGNNVKRLRRAQLIDKKLKGLIKANEEKECDRL